MASSFPPVPFEAAKGTSEVARLALFYKSALEQHDTDIMNQMASKWLQIDRGLAAKVNSLTDEIANRWIEGKPVTQAWLNEIEYYKQLEEQARNAAAGYVNWAQTFTQQQLLQTTAFGIDEATNLMNAGRTQSMGYFRGLPKGQIESIQALLMADAPLDKLFGSIIPGIGNNPIGNALLQGFSMGMPVKDIAKLMSDTAAIPYKRSLLIARTETNRAHRASTLYTYQKYGVVKKYKRMASRKHACMACQLLDGTVYPANIPLSDHPNGACTMVPWVDGMKEPTWETGTERFMNMNEEQQRAQMGNNYYDAWKRGDFKLQDMVKINHNSTWGDSPGLVPLKTLSPNWKSYRAAAPKMPAAIASTTGLSIDTPLTVAQRQAALDRLNSLGNEGLYEKVRLLAMNKAGLAGATQTEIDAFKEYTGLGYTTLNYDLRRASKLSKADAALDKHMAEVYLKLPPTEGDMVVVRGLGDWKPEDAVVGGKIVDPGYMSTSLTNSFWGNRYEIYVPAGSGNVAFIRDISRIKSEDELLFNKNSVLEVLEITRKGEYNTYKLIYKGNLGD